MYELPVVLKTDFPRKSQIQIYDSRQCLAQEIIDDISRLEAEDSDESDNIANYGPHDLSDLQGWAGHHRFLKAGEAGAYSDGRHNPYYVEIFILTSETPIHVVHGEGQRMFRKYIVLWKEICGIKFYDSLADMADRIAKAKYPKNPEEYQRMKNSPLPYHAFEMRVVESDTAISFHGGSHGKL